MFVNILDKQIYYQIIGKGQPIIMVHGWGGTSASFSELTQLMAKEFQVITVDLPGFGQSENPLPNWGIEEYAQIVIDLLNLLHLNNVNYFGHSFGGSLGIYISSHYSEKINKMILCNSSYKRNIKPSKLTKYLKNINPLLKRLIYRLFFPNSDLFKYPHLESNFRIIITEDLSSSLSKIKAPTLILWGEKDKDTPIILAKELHQKIKNSFLKVFPLISHNLPIKYPKLVYQEIKKFLC